MPSEVYRLLIPRVDDRCTALTIPVLFPIAIAKPLRKHIRLPIVVIYMFDLYHRNKHGQ